MTSPDAQFHTEETIVGKAFDRRLMARLLRYAVPYRGAMVLAIVLILLVTALGLAGPFIVREAVDGPLREVTSGSLAAEPGAEAFHRLYRLTALFAAVSLVLLALRYVQGILMAWIGQKVMLDLRSELFHHLIHMPFAFFDRNPVGRLVTRVTSDIEALSELFAGGFVSLIADMLILAAITAALLWVNAALALVTLSALPLLLIATFLFRAKVRRYYREQRAHIAHLNAITQESIQGMNVVQAFHRQRSNQKRYEDVNRLYQVSFLRSVLAYSVYYPVIELMGTGALIAVIWQASRQLGATPPELTLGNFFLFWYFLGRFFQPIRDMAERYNVLQAAMASAERVFQVLDTPETMPDPPGARPLEKLEGRVAFENVWFAYRGDDHVLRDINFEVKPAQMVAIVGATGAGKSTIINLISRFYDPQRGRILADGRDIREIRKRELRARISVVLQDVFLFSRSIRENIALDTPGISDEDVRRVARHVNASPFIERLPGGYDEVLKERGRTLSVGEKQLLAFARTLVHDPDILILDEATAHIDSETEALIQDALDKLLAGRTSIVIAHRLSTIRRADRIIVLHKGEVREEGTHRELFARGGIYRCLYELQYRG
ncbi:MAG: ABC transporter ATP-binding protein [Planctomycetes bacterium]|nr:ABC transporter ATP-binding protein [Planctomycetota bacterium]